MQIARIECIIVVFIQILISVKTQDNIKGLFSQCRKTSKTFDLCMKNALNELRVYFTSGKVPLLTIEYLNL